MAFNDDLTLYTLKDGTEIGVKDDIPADNYFEISKEWIKVEQLPTDNALDIFARDEAELVIIKLIFDTYLNTSYSELSSTHSYRELSTVASEVFVFLGKGIDRSAILKSKSESVDTKTQTSAEKTKED